MSDTSINQEALAKILSTPKNQVNPRLLRPPTRAQLAILEVLRAAGKRGLCVHELREIIPEFSLTALNQLNIKRLAIRGKDGLYVIGEGRERHEQAAVRLSRQDPADLQKILDHCRTIAEFAEKLGVTRERGRQLVETKNLVRPEKPLSEKADPKHDAELVRLYTAPDGKTTQELARMFGIGLAAVTTRLKVNGVKLHRRHSPSMRKFDYTEAGRLYLDGATLAQLADKYQTTIYVISRTLDRIGVAKRKPSEFKRQLKRDWTAVANAYRSGMPVSAIAENFKFKNPQYVYSQMSARGIKRA